MSEETSSRIDPLSPATRGAKRNLLIAAMVAIAFKAFDVRIEKLPFGPVVINFDKGVFEFGLIAVLAYFWVAFVIYYYIDIRNFGKTKHETETQKEFLQRLNMYSSHRTALCQKKIDAITPDGFRVIVHHEYPVLLNQSLARSVEPGKTIDLKGHVYLSKRRENSRQYDQVSAIQGEELTKIRDDATEILLSQFDEFARQHFVYRLSLLPRYYLIKMTYLFRSRILDGALPICLGVLAMVGLYDLISLAWIADIVPASAKMR